MKNLQKCPDEKTLNAYFDGELESGLIVSHIKSCQSCARRLEKIKKVSELINKAVISEASKSEDISEKAINALRFSQRRSRIRYASYSEIFLKIAAIFALFSAVIFYTYQLLEQRNSITQEFAENQPKSEYPIEENLSRPHFARQVENFSSDNRVKNQMNTIEIAKMRNVDAGQTDAKNLYQIFGAKENEKAKYIATYVKHNWLEEKGRVGESFIDIARKYNLNLKSISKEDSVERFSIIMNKAELVAFVKALQSAGYKLLSPEEPQPESNKFYGSPTEQVEYDFSLIRK